MSSNQINRDELTDICDSGTCEHDSGMWHVRGAGVYCDECSNRRIKTAFDADAEQREQDQTRADQREMLADAGIDSNASEI